MTPQDDPWCGLIQDISLLLGILFEWPRLNESVIVPNCILYDLNERHGERTIQPFIKTS